ncbi:MAG: hypothetical protein AAF799_27420 [Myxococcota bacterium]
MSGRGILGGVVMLVAACAKPLAPAPTTPQVEPAPAPAEPDDARSYQMPRDPKGGYVSDDPPPPRDPVPDRPPPPPHDPPPPPQDPEQPKCTRAQFVVERCITGGAPRRGPDGRLEGRTSCSTRCEAKPPAPHPSRQCRKIDARHYQCKSFAP